MRSEQLAIGLAVVVQQIIKQTPNQNIANDKIYQIGRQMGIRMADQFRYPDCSYLSLAQTVKSIIVKTCQDSFGLILQLSKQNTKIQKRAHVYQLTYIQSNTSKSFLSLCQDIEDKFFIFNPCYLIAGFIYGILQTMNFYGKVNIVKDKSLKEKITYVISVQKDIKKQD